jgi:hypothetical protein
MREEREVPGMAFTRLLSFPHGISVHETGEIKRFPCRKVCIIKPVRDYAQTSRYCADTGTSTETTGRKIGRVKH